ncbi:MAG: hypothetical protein IKQ54_06665 [Oscillospiraceae bacterium]|nr:hypothetical protein [Oscillospiraceae bacterium]
MKRFLALTLAVLLSWSILLSGCGDSPQPPAESAARTTEAAEAQTVSTAAAETTAAPAPAETAAEPETENIYLADYRQFWEILETDYPYLPFLEKRYSNLQEIRESFEAVAAKTDNLGDFIKLLNKVCARLGNFAHLNLIEPGFYQYLYSVLAFDPVIADDPYMAAYFDAITDPTLNEIYQPVAADYVQQQTEKAPEVQLRYTEKAPEVQLRYYDDCDALLLVISTFDHNAVERDRNVLTDALKQYPNTKHIIFDISRNGGGDDMYWERNLVMPLGGDPSELEYRLFYRNTERISPYFSAFHSVPVSELTDVPDWVSELKLDRCIPFDPEAFEPEAGAEPLPGSDAKRWVLVSGSVYSSSEKFTIFCKSTGWATLVGTTTGGDGIGVTPVFAKLDRTGLLIRFTADVALNPTTGQPSAFSGTVPDYPGSLDTCLEMIRSQ